MEAAAKLAAGVGGRGGPGSSMSGPSSQQLLLMESSGRRMAMGRALDGAASLAVYGRHLETGNGLSWALSRTLLSPRWISLHGTSMFPDDDDDGEVVEVLPPFGGTGALAGDGRGGGVSHGGGVPGGNTNTSVLGRGRFSSSSSSSLAASRGRGRGRVATSSISRGPGRPRSSSVSKGGASSSMGVSSAAGGQGERGGRGLHP